MKKACLYLPALLLLSACSNPKSNSTPTPPEPPTQPGPEVDRNGFPKGCANDHWYETIGHSTTIDYRFWSHSLPPVYDRDGNPAFGRNMCDTTFFSANVGRDNDEPSFYQGVETGKAFYGGEAVETDLRWAVTVMSTGHWLRVFDVQRSLIFSVTKLNNGKYDGNRSPSEYIPSLDMTIDEVWEKYYRSPDYVKKLLDSSL